MYRSNVSVSQCGKDGDAEIIEGPPKWQDVNSWYLVPEVKDPKDQKLDHRQSYGQSTI
jgi:hypothetical protein